MNGWAQIGQSLITSRREYEFGKDLQERQMSWQENMSNSAWKRSVADMRKAGLNPAMMYGGAGGPASTPSGGAAGSTGNFAAHLASASQARLVQEQVKLIKEQINNVSADTRNKVADTFKKDAEEENVRTNSALTKYHLPEARSQSKLYEDPKAGPLLKSLRWIRDMFSGRGR